MRVPVRRRWIAIAVLFLGPVVTVAAASDWASETTKDIFAYPTAEKEIRELAQQREEYQDEINRVKQRCAIKETILDELEAGQITLFEAAARFQRMDRNSPVISALLYPADRTDSFDEIAAVTVISHMRTRLNAGQPLFAGTLTRLNREFEKAYGYRPEK